MAEKTEKDLIELAKELGCEINIKAIHSFGKNFRVITLTKEQK